MSKRSTTLCYLYDVKHNALKLAFVCTVYRRCTCLIHAMFGQFPHKIRRCGPHKQLANESGTLRDAGQRGQEIAVAQPPLLYIGGIWYLAPEHDPVVLRGNKRVLGK